MARIHINQLDPSLISANVNGEVLITGSLNVDGQTTLTQTDPDEPGLVVSGSLEVVQAQIDQAIQLAAIRIENLGTIADPAADKTIDLGGFF